jgi:cyclic beta-1,2-glucan synthetase
VWRARTADAAEVYQVEPYVVAADVYSNARHRGRGGWTWYTGSAGWMLRVTLESILGVTLEGGSTLVVRAAIPAGWPGYRMMLRPFGRPGTWEIEVRNSAPPGTQVATVTVDGQPISPVDGVARVPLPDDGRDHRATIQLR